MSSTRPVRTIKGTWNPPTVGTPGLPFLTTKQMREVDRLMVEEYGVLLTQMMGHAGRNLGQLARVRFLGGDPRCRRVVVLAGVGANGGGGLVAARWLHNRNAEVSVCLTASASHLRDIPGVVHDPAIRATANLTLAAPKRRFLASKAREHVGELYLGDIGVPPELYTVPSLNLKAGPVFAADDVVRLW